MTAKHTMQSLFPSNRAGTTPLCLARISVRGIVQGVGFRPFVYRMATRHGLKGWVCNTSQDVKIEVEGGEGVIRSFLDKLLSEAPPRSQIEHVDCTRGETVGYEGFEILESLSEEGQYQLVSPDIATCPDCERELFDPRDRRYRYPFINCTNCGPRLTIIKDIPYDRPNTTMHPFHMCPECQREYNDPHDRRFHAQPDCCGSCGPQLVLTERDGRPIPSREPVLEAARLIHAGKIIALKGQGGFLLACDAGDEEVVSVLRQRKQRSSKPFALMMENIEEIKRYCHVSPEEAALLKSPRAPIVLLNPRDDIPALGGVAPNLDTLGVMLPYTPLHHLLMRAVKGPLVMTSGNISEEPIVGDNEEALKKLGHIADFFLMHNRDIFALCDDSVTLMEEGRVRVLRRARGYAPQPIRLPFDAGRVLACGAHMKSTFCITKDRYAFISQHIGDLENLETLTHFEKMLDLYKRLFRLTPRILAHDKHPDYLSTGFAREINHRDPSLELVPIQHHHAHVVSCMVENGVDTPVLGVAFDGTGYGDDGAIWGGEFLLADYQGFRRLAHLEYVPLPGGDAAVKRPWRMAVSYLVTLLGEKIRERKVDIFSRVDPLELELTVTQIRKGINSPLTSSAGRLFDAVSALIGIRDTIDYEGQAAVELEAAGSRKTGPGLHYPVEIREQGKIKQIGLRGIFLNILNDLDAGVGRGEIAFKFHHTVAWMTATVCAQLSRETGIDLVALSGGVFQNRWLLRLASCYLEEMGLRVLTHSEIPCNDGGISLGQAVAAHFVMDT